MATNLGEIQIAVMGVPVTVRGAIYYPPEPETRIEPSEPSFAEWGAVFIDGTDVSELFAVKHNYEMLEEALIASQEGW